MVRNRGPIAMVEDVLGCKWTMQILAAISVGCRRPGRLRRSIAGISKKVLNERLAKLMRYGVLERTAYAQRPPRVEYRLTRKGRELGTLVRRVDAFCRRWDDAITSAKRRSAAGGG